MSSKTFINYWIGEERTPPSPGLDEMPAYVDIAPLAFVTIDDKYELNFDFPCKTHPESEIKVWIRRAQANGTRVLLSINDAKIADVPDVDAFVGNVVANVNDWGVDGIDIDFEPPSPSETVLEITKALRGALISAGSTDPLLTAPIYAPWTDYPDFLRSFAAELDFLTTMDYTPYPGFEVTTELFEQYAAAIGTPEKLAIGVSCMDPPRNFTPLEDVKRLCEWEPKDGSKKGVMLYTFSYDVKARDGAGTGYPNGTFTKTIRESLA